MRHKTSEVDAPYGSQEGAGVEKDRALSGARMSGVKDVVARKQRLGPRWRKGAPETPLNLPYLRGRRTPSNPPVAA
jgi:hypothetical protein